MTEKIGESVIHDCRCKWCRFWRATPMIPTGDNRGLKEMRKHARIEWEMKHKKKADR